MKRVIFCIIGWVLVLGLHAQIVDDDAEGPPLPIPNTEVKLSCAENTWLVTARKDREMPTQAKHLIGCFALYSSIAQSVVRVYRNVPETIT